MQLVFLSLAVQDLASIREYIAENNPQAAQKVANRLKQSINRLASMPNLGKPGRVFGTRELVTPLIGKTAYVVVYRVKENRLEILRGKLIVKFFSSLRNLNLESQHNQKLGEISFA